MRDLFDDLMSRVERRDPWSEIRVENETPVEDESEFPVDFEDDEIPVE